MNLDLDWAVLDPPEPGDLILGLDWRVKDSAPFDYTFSLGWAVETPAGPDPDCFLVWDGYRVPARMRVTTADGRFP